MTPFLKQVARHYYTKEADISSLCFIFPSRRSLRFFEHYLGEEVAASGRGPVVSPRLFTMNDFVARTTSETPSDRIQLLLELYSCYRKLNQKAEPLDDFIFWGDTLLGDFDDIDKYLVDPGQLFANVSDIKEMQDDWSYLTEPQREALQRFTRHFLTPGAVKEGFLSIWRILLPLYGDFRQALRDKGLCYEGMMYRDLCDRFERESAADIFAARHEGVRRFVFVGLNALNECERVLLRKMHKARMCEFCWDFRSDAIRDADNKSSVFLGTFTKEFPSAFEPDPEGLPDTEFNLLSVPGGIAQAKQLPEILACCDAHPGIETAVVLPDEKMILPVLSTIPEHIDKLNVTMGYPIDGSQMWALLSDIALLQTHLREREPDWHFYHRQVWAVASNAIVRTVLSEEGARQLDAIRRERRYYIPQSAFAGDPVLEAIFRPVATRPEADASQVAALCRYLQNVLTTVAPLLKNVPGMELELDFAKVCHEALGRLLEYELPLLSISFFRLLSQILSSSTVPFQGEPLQGLQIMGPLELRAMDFDNLIILNFNEGVFPRRSVSASFIPPELRRGFGLPTYEYQDAVWAYYFYRSIQRARKVWMVYDSRTEGLKGGEPSRYLRQLEMHFGVKVQHFEAIAPLGKGVDGDSIPKTQAHLDALHGGRLSASSVKSYLTCPVKFFYSKVEALEAEKEVSESLDAGMLGNVLHKTMQELYPERCELDTALLEGLLKDKKRVRGIVEKNICQELKTFEVAGRNLVFADVICSYVEAVLKADLEQVREGGAIRILGTEKLEKMDIGGFSFVGYIDRLDSPSKGTLRVVDYKTGRVEPEDLYFDEKTGKVPQIGLQLYLYKRLVAAYAAGRTVTGAIYKPAALMGGDPVIAHELDEEYCRKMDAELDAVLSEISDLSVPWVRTDNTDDCKWCDFRAICGR